uniref:Secreted protein n=1 Tax=Mesocestoides corti TaxID=53468 RepID=A0A5K3FUR0_MESCO
MSGVREKPGSINILVLVVLFSRRQVPRRCNGDGNLVSGLALSLRSVIQCPRDTTQPKSHPQSHDVANMACFSPSINGITPKLLLSVTHIH